MQITNTLDIMLPFLASLSNIKMDKTIPNEPPSNETIVNNLSTFPSGVLSYKYLFSKKTKKPTTLITKRYFVNKSCKNQSSVSSTTIIYCM